MEAGKGAWRAPAGPGLAAAAAGCRPGRRRGRGRGRGRRGRRRRGQWRRRRGRGRRGRGRACLQRRRLVPASDGARALICVERRDSAELDRAVLGEVLRRPLQRLGHVRSVDDHRLLTVTASLELAGDWRHLIAVGGIIAAANVEERHLLLLEEEIGAEERIGRPGEEKMSLEAPAAEERPGRPGTQRG